MSEPGSPPAFSVVIVDDDPISGQMLRDLVEALPGTEVRLFSDPIETLAWCRAHEPDLIITDHQMPECTGTELIRELRLEERLAERPIMMITATQDREVRYEALESGATDFLTKPIDAVEVRARGRTMLAIRAAQRASAARASSLEWEVRRATAVIAAREHETIIRLSRAAEQRDWESSAHVIRVAWYSRIVARKLDLAEDEQETLFRAAPLHDVGKIGVPDYILLKPGALDDAEFGIMKQHCLIGYQILGGSESELLRAAAEVALTHHERYDGSGYPDGLQGEQIPLWGRIVAVADSFDALTSDRPYKKEWPAELAWSYLRENAGRRFDRACVDAFCASGHEVREVRASFPDRAAEDRLAARRGA